MRGRFIVIEGADGSGTTSVVEAIEKRYPRIIRTAEPTSGPIGRLLREYLSGDAPRVSNKVLEHLFRADRLDHVQSFIEPVLENGKTLVCDRYTISTLVYQSIRDSLKSSIHAMQFMYDEMTLSEGDLLVIPDLVIFLDADVDVMAKRVADRINTTEKTGEIFEVPETQRMVVDLYREWFDNSSYTENRVRVDANKPLKDVLGEVYRHIDSMVISTPFS